eukprot:GHVU01064331.1.p1 GENE.GHVU01064331.1~~GHVU01064331.1.p1  ORF type:complete len:222 (-),score=16.63 GHVU01064331.1:217-882(-)
MRICKQAAAGIARAVRPCFTVFDGDAVFAITTDEVDVPDLYGETLLGEVAAEGLKVDCVCAHRRKRFDLHAPATTRATDKTRSEIYPKEPISGIRKARNPGGECWRAAGNAVTDPSCLDPRFGGRGFALQQVCRVTNSDCAGESAWGCDPAPRGPMGLQWRLHNSAAREGLFRIPALVARSTDVAEAAESRQRPGGDWDANSTLGRRSPRQRRYSQLPQHG